jgi:hypothetical protein
MPTFDTPEPIAVHLEIGVGEIRIAAAARTDTVVEIRPADPAKKGDVTAAEVRSGSLLPGLHSRRTWHRRMR